MGCSQCGGCCKMMGFTIPNLQERREYVTYFKTHGCQVKDNVVIVPMRCPHLTEDNKCDIHDKKPLLCKQFKGKNSGNRFLVPKECTYD